MLPATSVAVAKTNFPMTGRKMTSENKKKDVQARGWMLTIPADKHSTKDVRALLSSIFTAAVFQKERGENTGFEHYQCYGQNAAPIRWTTLKNKLRKAGFQDTHFEKQWATADRCYKYCTKTESRIESPQVIGTIAMHDKPGERTDIQDIKDKVLNQGMTYNDLLLADDTGNVARYRLLIKDLELAKQRQLLKTRKWRNMTVNYLHGKTGIGKSRYVVDRYSADELYRATDYSHLWDLYEGQPVLVLEEFTGQPSIESMLMWLDGYTVQLPARYENKISNYTTVWVLSNLDFQELYRDVPAEQRAAFSRRFSHFYTLDGSHQLVEEDARGYPLHLGETTTASE